MELCLAEGLGALSARRLAARSDFSASAMTYHFGGRAQLVLEVQVLTRAALAEWRSELAKDIAELRPAWLSTAAWLCAALTDLLSKHRAHLTLQWELEAESEMEDGPLHDGAEAELAAMHAFWREGAARTGAAPEAAEVWANLAEGLVTALLSETDQMRRMAWIFDGVMRLDARLRRASVSPAPAAHSGAPQLLAEPPGAEGARRILDGALRVVAAKGVDRLTLRDVAAAAEVSLAATTHFFRTKNELLTAAFNELHRQVRAEVLQDFERETPAVTSPRLLDRTSALSWRVQAMEALHRAAVRDPALRPLAQDILTTRGSTSLPILRRSGVADADPLDAFIWSTSMSAVLRRIRLAAPDERGRTLDETGRAHMRVLFGIET